MKKNTVETRRTINKFAEKKALLNVLERLWNVVEEIDKDARQEYVIVGKEDEQARRWGTDELMWEDEEKTIPKYRDKWDYVPRTEEEMTDEQFGTILAVETIKKALEELM